MRRVSAFTYRHCKRGRLQEVPQTPMFQQLANTVGDGRCHVSESRNWADAAAQEGARAPATIAWASVGQGAKQNAERDLFRWLNLKELIGIEPYVVWLPRELKNETQLLSHATAILSPHEVMHAVHSMGGKQWAVTMMGLDLQEGIDEFWRRSSVEDWFKAHPGCQDPALLKRTIPLVFHVDGVEVYSGCEANIWSMSSAVASGHTPDVNIPILAVMEEEMSMTGVRKALHLEVCKFLAWSLEFCASGKGPAQGYYKETFPRTRLRHSLSNEFLAGGWRGILVGIKCDGKMKVQMHNFSRFYKCGSVCESCLACQNFKQVEPLLSYGNLSKTAPWRTTRISYRTYLLTEPVKSPWTQVSGFHLDMVWRDWMHVVYQGVGQDLGGALIYDMVAHQELESEDVHLGLKKLYHEMAAWCKENKLAVPQKVFSMKAIGRSATVDFPCLSSEYKAAHVKATFSNAMYLLHTVPYIACMPLA